MAQTGYTPIQLYYSSTTTNVPLAANLAYGELAINITDGKLFYKDNANAIQVIGWKVVPATAGGTGQTSYAVGDLIYANTTTTLAKLADVATGNALISGGVSTAPSWGKIGLTTHVSGTLPTANGGTNLTSFTANGLLYASSSSVLATGSDITFDGTNFATTGNASAKAFIPTSSTIPTNGIFYPASNTVGIACNSAETARFSSDTFLLGTTSAAPITSRFYSVGKTTMPAAWFSAPFTSGYAVVNIGRTASTGSLIEFWNQAQNGTVGSISTDNSTTTYGTTSDYRLKENVQRMTGALDKVLRLNPVTFDWKATGKPSQGFIAHELQEIVPECVVGEKDGIQIRDGQEFIVHQNVDTSFLVATLTAAIQELKADFDAYKATHP
jgi:hypothetical protein